MLSGGAAIDLRVLLPLQHSVATFQLCCMHHMPDVYRTGPSDRPRNPLRLNVPEERRHTRGFHLLQKPSPHEDGGG